MTLGRLFTIVVAFLFVTASCILLAGNNKAAKYEDLKTQAQSAINQANKNPAVNASPTQEKSDVPKLITSPGYVRINYVSEKMIAYYTDKHLIAIEYLDLTQTVIKRNVFDLQGRLRVQVLYETPSLVKQEDYFDEKGKRITHNPYPLPVEPGQGVYH